MRSPRAMLASLREAKRSVQRAAAYFGRDSQEYRDAIMHQARLVAAFLRRSTTGDNL